MIRNLVIISYLVASCLGCSNLEEKPVVNYEREAALILDSINSLDSADLVKINTRGCVGNCLPAETFAKWMKYVGKLEKLGYLVDWNERTNHYVLNKID